MMEEKNVNKKLGCDLDGVIAINNLNKADYRPYRLHEYYSKAKPTGIHKNLVPGIIITERTTHYDKLTIQWLENNGIEYETLIMFPSKDKKSNKTLAEFKAKYINEYGLREFYEDDELIAEQLKGLCPNTEIIKVSDITHYTSKDGKDLVAFLLTHTRYIYTY